MRILVVGSGGREHALVWKLLQSPQVSAVYAAPGNPGTEAEGAISVPISVTSEATRDEVVAFAKKESIDLVVPGPELPLTLGITDALAACGIPCFGPDRFCAQLEGSKSFAKRLMEAHGVPTAKARVVTTMAQAEAALAEMGAPLVVKADGLAAGKGVFIAETKEDALEYVRAMIEKKCFGDSGATVLLEERLVGEEVSLLCFCDGSRVLPLPSAQDHKAAFDGDRGPNTGGMGAYSPCPLVPDEVAYALAEKTVLPIVRALAAQGHPYVGVLYAGLMMTKDGPKVLEYNVRFGDPECQPLMLRLSSDMVPILTACVRGDLSRVKLDLRPEPAVGVVLASDGYPRAYVTGQEVVNLADLADEPDLKVFLSGVRKKADTLVVSGGRILCVTALGKTIAQAQARAYTALDHISCVSAFYRHDIGAKALRSRTVVVLMGSGSDAERVQPCCEVLRSLDIPFYVTITSAHRTPERTEAIIRESEELGCKVFICAAGMAAHLAGAVAARTLKPVLGIPLSGSALGGMDALLSTVQMPAGFPVATLALDAAGARNAAWLAASIIALTDPPLAQKIQAARERMREDICAHAAKLAVGDTKA